MPRIIRERINPYAQAIWEFLVIAYAAYREEYFLVFLGMFVALNSNNVFAFLESFEDPNFVRNNPAPINREDGTDLLEFVIENETDLLEFLLERVATARNTAPSAATMPAENGEPLLPSIQNTHTFLHQVPVDEIPAEKLIVLDLYKFDVDEFVAYARDLTNIYKNPHRHKTEFSLAAKELINNHPVLGVFARQFAEQLAIQKSRIKPATIDALTVMLNAIHTSDPDADTSPARDEAQARFYAHLDVLTPEERKHLDNYIIQLPVIGGGFQRMTFEAALTGGGIMACIKTMQMFLWQFVVTIRPEAFGLVPMGVREVARENRYVITPAAPTDAEMNVAANSFILFRARVPVLAQIVDGMSTGHDIPTPRLD